MEPEKVPVRLESRIDYKFLLVILVGVVSFQLYLYSLHDEEKTGTLIDIISPINPAIASIAAFIVAKRYHKSEVFGKAYFALGLAMLMIFLGEITYTIYDYLGIDPYPSIADVFFLSAYPLAFYHLAKNILFFKPRLKLAIKILIPSIPISIVSIYSVLSFLEIGEANFDYYYGLLYVIGSSVVVAAAVLGASVFRQGVLGTAWLLLAVGLLLNSLGDTWYSYLEIFGQYDLIHPVNLLWYTAYWIIAYSLYKHKKVI